jgi:hypothetical protein
MRQAPGVSRELNPRFRELRPEVLRLLPPAQLASAVYEHVLHHCLPDLDHELTIVAGLPPAVRAIYTTTVLENEVVNGGFNQYFWNSSGQLAFMALEGLDLIGATGHAAILGAAIATYESERAVLQRFRHDGSAEAFSESYDHTELGGLDDQYYALGSGELERIQTSFILGHFDAFQSDGPAA